MRSHPTLTLTVRSLCVLALAVVARADVIVVDSNRFGDFQDIQAGIDGAMEGDTILVRRPPIDGTPYPGFVIEGKAVTIVGPEGESLPTGPVVVCGIDGRKSVVLRNLDVNVRHVGIGEVEQEDVDAPGMSLERNSGAVVLQNVRIQGTDIAPYLFPDHPGTTALSITDCASVVLRGCELVGGMGAMGYSGGDGGAGIETDGAEVVLYGCAVTGGRGGSGDSDPYAPGGDGGDGVRVVSGLVHAAGCELGGGAGGEGGFGASGSHGGAGGTGIEVLPGAVAYAVDTTALGGQGGFGLTLDGSDGRPSIGRVVSVAGIPAELIASARAPERSTLPVLVRGEPGEQVTLLVSRRIDSRSRGPRAGFSHAGVPVEEQTVGVLPASGELTFDYATPNAPPDGATGLFLQARLRSSNGTRFSALAHVVVLDVRAEPVCGARVYVDADALPGGDGSSWANAFRELQDGLDATADCVEHATPVWVAEGRYVPENRRGFFVHAGVHVYGGFAGTETRLDERDPAAHPVILDGDLNGDDGPGFTGRGDNAHHVVGVGNRIYPSRNSRLDGLHVRGGTGLAPSDLDSRGGGIYAVGSTSIVRCLVEDNDAFHEGAGIYCVADAISIESCRLIGNGNSCLYAPAMNGGAGSLFVNGSVFAGNGGSAIRILGGSADVRSSLVFANTEHSFPAGLSLVNAKATVANTIFWGNENYAGERTQGVAIGGSGPLALEYSLVQGLDGTLGGAGNIDGPPGLVDALGPDGIPGTLDDDLHLSSTSPCIDAGTNAGVAPDIFDLDLDGDVDEPVPFDLDGSPRFADELTVPDTGEGSPPVVDMGPYEVPGA